MSSEKRTFEIVKNDINTIYSELDCHHLDITYTKSKLDRNVYHQTIDDVNCVQSSSVNGVYITIVDKLYESEKIFTYLFISNGNV